MTGNPSEGRFQCTAQSGLRLISLEMSTLSAKLLVKIIMLCVCSDHSQAMANFQYRKHRHFDYTDGFRKTVQID